MRKMVRRKASRKNAAALALFLLGPVIVSARPAAAGAPSADEKAVIEKVIRDNIGWALTKDRPLAESTMRRDGRLFIFNPDSASTIGWSQLVKNFEFWLDPRFKAVKTEIRDLRIDVSPKGDAAWWSCMLDDLCEWDGKPAGWKDVRWTGVMEKRAGRWIIAQMHFSFPNDRVAAETMARVKAAAAFPALQGPYLGQKPPGTVPEIFAPGVVCTGLMERDVAISPDGREIYFGIGFGDTLAIMVSRCRDDRWSEPEIAPFAADPNFLHFEPCLSPDGNRVFFLTNRPVKGQEPKPGWANQNIWAADRKPDGSWGEPYDPGPAINGGETQQFYPSMSRNGTLYFARKSGRPAKLAIWRARPAGAAFAEAEKLPDQINGKGTPYNASIAPDESYLIACIDGRPYDANPGFANYFVFFRDKDDRWSEGVPLGPEVNMNASTAVSSSVSPDGKYLFFAAQKTAGGLERKTLRQIIAANGGVQNGNYDIYWVSTETLEKLRSAR